VHGSATADGSEAGLVGEVVTEIKREGLAVSGLSEEPADGLSFTAYRARQNFDVANIPHSEQRRAKRFEDGAKLASNARLHSGGNIQEMNGETAAFVFNPKARIRFQERL
jgi:hypothetical protein